MEACKRLPATVPAIFALTMVWTTMALAAASASTAAQKK